LATGSEIGVDKVRSEIRFFVSILDSPNLHLLIFHKNAILYSVLKHYKNNKLYQSWTNSRNLTTAADRVARAAQALERRPSARNSAIAVAIFSISLR
jgi:hypothetical protein